MKPILPRGSGVPQIQGIFSSPRTTIILAPAAASSLPLGTALSSPLILPAPPTSTITLAAHRVPQPTPVILPLTKSPAPSGGAQLPCPPLAPKSFSPRSELQDQPPPAALALNGKSLKRHPHKKNKGRKDVKQIQNKCSNAETPILPKRSQADTQTVILLPSAPGKAVALPPVLVPKCSVVISDDMQSHVTLKEGKKTKKNDKDLSKKRLIKTKRLNQDKSPQGKNNELDKNEGSFAKTMALKFSKKAYVDDSITVVGEASKTKPSGTRQDGGREVSSLPLEENTNSMYSPETFILSAEGYLSQSDNYSHQQDVPHHPPPPYPQDSLLDTSAASGNSAAQQDPDKTLKEATEPAVSGAKLFPLKRKECEWKHKKHSVAERISIASSSTSAFEMKSDISSKPSDGAVNHTPASLPSPLSVRCAQPCTPATSSSSLSADAPIGKTCKTDTTVTSSCSSSACLSHSSVSRNRNMSPSASKSSTHHDPHTALPDDAQVLLLKSSQSKSCEPSYPLSAAPDGVGEAGVTSGSSLSSELPSTQLVSHTAQCSKTSVVTHMSSATSLSHEANTSISSCTDAASYEHKSGPSLPSQTGLQFTLNTQRSQNSLHPTVGTCDQAAGSPFYLQPSQCSTSLQSVLHSHSPIPCTDTNSANTASFPSYMSPQDQTFIHKVTSHSSSQPSSYAQTLQPTPYVDPSNLNSYSQSQPKFITKSAHPPHSPSHQLPSYTQSSLTQTAISVPDHFTSHTRSSPSATQDHSSQTSYVESPHPCLDTEQVPYLHSTQSHPLCVGQHGKAAPDHHSPQGVSFSQYTPSYPSPQGASHSHASYTHLPVENLSTMAVFKDNSKSPVLPLYAAPHDAAPSQCYMAASSMPYASQPSGDHEPHYYSLGRFKSLTASSSSTVDVVSSHLILEKSLNPPSYEAHIQNAASYVASGSNTQVIPDEPQHGHHQTSPANYSLSCPVVRDQGIQSLQEHAKKIVNSACSSPSPLLSLTSSPRYTYNPQLTHEEPHIDHSIIADIAQGTYDYDIEESSQTYFHSTTPDAQLALAAETQPPNTAEYSEGHSTSIHVTASHCAQSNSVHPRLQCSQGRVLVYPLARQESLYRSSDQDDVGLSGWSSTARSTGHPPESLRIEKLFFVPQSEQTHLYMKKEAPTDLSSDAGTHLRKDLMLKKFWIEEDEPIAEEIVSSLPSRLPPTQTLASKENKARQMLCQICGKMLRGRNSLRCHLNSHHSIQPHACPTCGKSFTNRSVLVEHLRIHSGETPYLCSLCDAAFRTRSGLLRHGSKHTTARPHECSMCSKRFKTKLVLQQHMKLHLTDVFACSECGKTFERRKALAIHKAFHHHKTQRFRCPHCPKGYHFRALLNHHMQLHSNVHKHVCSVCGKAFVWRSGLAAHVKTHSSSRPKCDICDMSFASEKRLQTHYRHHTDPKPHQCKVCGRNFSHAYRLASHSLIHQEHREYACHQCDVVFTNAKKFRKHLVTHKKEEPKIYKLPGAVQVSKQTF